MIRHNLKTALMAATATASLALTGCAGGLGLGGSKTASASDAAEARADGKTDKAITLAEQAVLAAPRDAAAKAELGSSYLASGLFRSAQQAFDDALTLGDVSPRTALGFTLASIAVGDQNAALETLNEWRDAMAPADLGLAYALAGNPEMGAQILTNALRGGENTAVMRQNLAYAYALGGKWAAARIIAAEDVAPSELDKRITGWASTSRPEDYTARVASLLGVDTRQDAGMPMQLALGSTRTADELVAEAAAASSFAKPSGELPPVDLLAASDKTRELKPLDAPVGARVATASAPGDFGSAFGASDRVVAARVVSNPVVQSTPAPARAAERSTPQTATASRPSSAAARVAASDNTKLAAGSHLVQLASYGSESDAKRGWAIMAQRFPQISDRDAVITRAKVRGKLYYRVSAGNLAAASAKSLCATVKAAGQGCIAWEASKPLPGTIGSATRVASR